MKMQILNIFPLQTAKVFAVLSFVYSVAVLPIFIFTLPDHSTPSMWLFMLALPFIYTIFGFLSALFGAWVYNAVAKRMGGIEFTTQEVSDAQPCVAGVLHDESTQRS